MLNALRILSLLLIATIPDGVFAEKGPEASLAAGNFEKLTQGASYTPKGDKLNWVRRERASLTDPWKKSTNTYSARYAIVDVATRLGGDEVYLAGILPDGTSVIERWKFPKKKGRWSYTMTNPAPPIGTAAGPWSGSLALHAAAVTMSPLPATWYAPTITVVLESSSYGFIRSIEVDPEGRFLLFNRYPEGDVYSIDLSAATPTPTVLFSAAQHPELAQLGALDIAQHESIGRVCAVRPASIPRAMSLPVHPTVLYLIDANNDGIFESTQTIALDLDDASRYFDAQGACVWSHPWKRQ